MIIITMPTAMIHFSDEEDFTIAKYSKEWNMNKHDTVKKIVKQYDALKKIEEKKK